MKRVLVIGLLVLLVGSVLYAQQMQSPTGGPKVSQQPTTPRQWAAIEIYLSLGILVFILLVLGLQAFLIVRSKSAWPSKAILRINGLTLIVGAGLFLITAGYSGDQVSPVMGLLGTIAGYLLGTGEEPAKAQ